MDIQKADLAQRIEKILVQVVRLSNINSPYVEYDKDSVKFKDPVSNKMFEIKIKELK